MALKHIIHIEINMIESIISEFGISADEGAYLSNHVAALGGP